jgi:hypothetical protein
MVDNIASPDGHMLCSLRALPCLAGGSIGLLHAPYSAMQVYQRALWQQLHVHVTFRVVTYSLWCVALSTAAVTLHTWHSHCTHGSHTAQGLRHTAMLISTSSSNFAAWWQPDEYRQNGQH